MDNRMIRVVEDGDGNITLYAVDRNGNEYVHAGYGYTPDDLMRDIYAILIDGADATTLESNCLTNPTIIRVVRKHCAAGADNAEKIDDTTPITTKDYDAYVNASQATTIACSEDGKLIVHYDRLGVNGRRCFFGMVPDTITTHDPGITSKAHPLCISIYAQAGRKFGWGDTYKMAGICISTQVLDKHVAIGAEYIYVRTIAKTVLRAALNDIREVYRRYKPISISSGERKIVIPRDLFHTVLDSVSQPGLFEKSCEADIVNGTQKREAVQQPDIARVGSTTGV